jgi:hypothetical protein
MHISFFVPITLLLALFSNTLRHVPPLACNTKFHASTKLNGTSAYRPQMKTEEDGVSDGDVE